MDAERKKLTEELRRAGISKAAIDAAWPTWWDGALAASPSGRAELRFALARRLGLRSQPLLGERVEFVWNDEARFKHLTAEDEAARAAMTSFGMAIGKSLLQSVAEGPAMGAIDAARLREALLARRPFADLAGLVSTCWALGIPIIHLRVFPLDAKRMHAMVVHSNGRFAILLGHEARFPAQLAFTLAHELAHIMLGHLVGAPALVDLEDPATAAERDGQELEADGYALTVLTGSSDPTIETSIDDFNAPTLAQAVRRAAPVYRIDPGTLALCLAYRRQSWPVAMAALNMLYPDIGPLWQEVNGVAARQIGWDALTDDASDYLRSVMGLPDA
ncbi:MULTISPECIES: hypothetical protein [unclassified Novosphingobium]|uniref:hypothetical protein n=1 Tax=unclassified Novosphingobium TaxID=2644732 RepID=UPI0025F23AA3|nr:MULTISPECIES: hypothetical protein [unclassified Novosphingobium]HQV03494.1 hypothetical protein [Novosphingobium sp.]